MGGTIGDTVGSGGKLWGNNRRRRDSIDSNGSTPAAGIRESEEVLSRFGMLGQVAAT